MKSIRTRLIVLMTLLSLLCLFVAIFVCYGISNKIVLSEANEKSTQSALAYTNQLNGWLEVQGKMVTEMANDIVILGNYDKTYLYNYFAKKQQGNPYILSFYAGFEDKSCVFGDGWVPEASYDCTKRPWYTVPMEKKGLAFTAPYVDSATKKMIVTVGIPIVKDGKTIGVAAADVPVDFLTGIVDKASLGTGSYAMLIDAQNEIVTHKLRKDFMPTVDANQMLDKVAGGLYTKLSAKIKTGVAGTIIAKDFDGKNKYFIFSPLKSNGWAFVFVVPTALLEAPLKGLINGFIIAIIGALVISIFVAFFTGNFFVKPIIKLRGYFEVLANGDLTQKIDIKGRDEIAQLGLSYNSTIKDLNGIVHSIASTYEDTKEQSKSLRENSSNRTSNFGRNKCSDSRAC